MVFVLFQKLSGTVYPYWHIKSQTVSLLSILQNLLLKDLSAQRKLNEEDFFFFTSKKKTALLFKSEC